MIHYRSTGSVDFERTWIPYTKGFGDLESEFWIGGYHLRVLLQLPLQVNLKGHNSWLPINVKYVVDTVI